MNILVTGADGFIGTKLVEQLIKEGHDVFCHTFNDGDIAAKDALLKYNDKHIEHVFHLAARAFVPDSFKYTHDYFHTNVTGTVTALEFCRENKCSITFMSTYVYGTPQYLPIDEKHPISAITPYHQSKIAAEGLCEYYSNAFDINCVILRPFNVYGKGQNEQFLIPKIFNQMLDKSIEKIEVMDLEPKRDYIYIDDLIGVMVRTITPFKAFAIYNVGSGQSKSVEEAILDISIATNTHKPYFSTQQKRINEVMDCIADIKAIEEAFEFEPRYSLIDGIKAIVLGK